MNFNRILSLSAGILVAAGVLYSSVAPIWGWPNAQEVQDSISAIVVFISAVLAVITGNKVLQERNTESHKTDDYFVYKGSSITNPFEKDNL